MQPHINPDIQRRFIIAISLTSLILVAEVIGGLWTGSLALLSDSAHVLMDALALGLSYMAIRLSARPADDRHTFGFHRLEVLAALANGFTLGVIAIGIFFEALRRIQSPEPIKSGEMLIIAAIGLLINLAAAYVLGGHSHNHEGEHNHVNDRDINIHSAFLHVVGDAVSSMGVILAAVLIMLTGWIWIDPLVSVFIGVIILVSSGRVLRSALHILIEGVPEGLSLVKVDQAIKAVPGVEEVHDLHVWNICSGHISLSAHVVLCQDAFVQQPTVMVTLKERLSNGFGIDHTTVQFEQCSCADHPSAQRCK